jgi:hypothetical protein
MLSPCTTEYDISRCSAEWSASEAGQRQKLRDVALIRPNHDPKHGHDERQFDYLYVQSDAVTNLGKVR